MFEEQDESQTRNVRVRRRSDCQANYVGVVHHAALAAYFLVATAPDCTLPVPHPGFGRLTSWRREEDRDAARIRSLTSGMRACNDSEIWVALGFTLRTSLQHKHLSKLRLHFTSRDTNVLARKPRACKSLSLIYRNTPNLINHLQHVPASVYRKYFQHL